MVFVVLDDLEHHHWYLDIVYYLKNLTCLNGLVDHQRRALRLKASWYCMTRGGLGWRDLDGMVLRCVDDVEAQILMSWLHVFFTLFKYYYNIQNSKC
jgi:hypothetical protein